MFRTLPRLVRGDREPGGTRGRAAQYRPGAPRNGEYREGGGLPRLLVRDRETDGRERIDASGAGQSQRPAGRAGRVQGSVRVVAGKRPPPGLDALRGEPEIDQRTAGEIRCGAE